MHLPDSPYITESSQLIVVKANDWNSPPATMKWLERDDPSQEWKSVDEPFEIVVGKKGLALGQNLLPIQSGIPEFKKEGDNKTPAGLYRFCFAFGYAAEPDPGISWPYLALDENFVGVDDPKSRYYNCIVDQKKLTVKDWDSAETMLRSDGLYKWGLLVDYNFENGQPGAGSQIFLHIWRGAGQGTE